LASVPPCRAAPAAVRHCRRRCRIFPAYARSSTSRVGVAAASCSTRTCTHTHTHTHTHVQTHRRTSMQSTTEADFNATCLSSTGEGKTRRGESFCRSIGAKPHAQPKTMRGCCGRRSLPPGAQYRSVVPKFFLITCKIVRSLSFLPRDAMHKRGLCRHAVSVRVCVCHVRELCQNTHTHR